jgi:hypothetical protein
MSAKPPHSTPPGVAFKVVYDAMRKYAATTPKSGRCSAWRDFISHTKWQFGRSPKAMLSKAKVSVQFADYWLSVAAGTSPDYDAATGDWTDAL